MVMNFATKRLWIQAAKMSFLRRVAGGSLRDKVRSTVTLEEYTTERLCLSPGLGAPQNPPDKAEGSVWDERR